MRQIVFAVAVLAILAVLAFMGSTHAQQQSPSDFDVRVNALVAEFEAHVAQATRRSAQLAAELAATQAKLKAANEEIERLKKQKPAGK